MSDTKKGSAVVDRSSEYAIIVEDGTARGGNTTSRSVRGGGTRWQSQVYLSTSNSLQIRFSVTRRAIDKQFILKYEGRLIA